MGAVKSISCGSVLAEASGGGSDLGTSDGSSFLGLNFDDFGANRETRGFTGASRSSKSIANFCESVFLRFTDCEGEDSGVDGGEKGRV